MPDTYDPAAFAAYLDGRVLLKGHHDGTGSVDACALEHVAAFMGEPWSDKPACVCPVIGAFVRSWNDCLPDDDRDRLLKPLLPLVVGTRSTPRTEEIRSYMALDWLIRTHAVTWLEQVESLKPHAEALASLADVVDMETAKACSEPVKAARAAARAAAGAAAWAAAGAAAWAAAGAAAWAAAGEAARAASGAALIPTVTLLQASAQDLVRRMCEVPDA